MEKNATILSADWVLPVTAKPIENGAVVIEENRIKEVGTAEALVREYLKRGFSHQRYIRCAIMPGLINLHTHLDYSLMRFRVSNLNLFDWILELMSGVSAWDEKQFLKSASYGAALLALNGTTTVVDSSYSGLSAEAIAAFGLKGFVGLELFGLDRTKSEVIWQAWLDNFDKRKDKASTALKAALAGGRITLTVAPHAPYTVSPHLWQKAKDWSETRQVPLLGHLAESTQECAWIKGNDQSSATVVNEFLLKVMPVRPDRDTAAILNAIDWKGKGLSAVLHLKEYGLLNDRLLAAHCAHVDETDLEALAKENVGVAHCPRSNARLGNGRAPYEKFRSFGLKMGLGTDSLASCDDLSLLNEARFALDLHRACLSASKVHLSPTSRELLAAITIDAAGTIGKEGEIGSITEGKRADLAVFKLRSDSSPIDENESGTGLLEDESETGPLDLGTHSQPEDLIVHSSVKLEDLFVDGERVVRAGRLRISAPLSN